MFSCRIYSIGTPQCLHGIQNCLCPSWDDVVRIQCNQVPVTGVLIPAGLPVQFPADKASDIL